MPWKKMSLGSGLCVLGLAGLMLHFGAYGTPTISAWSMAVLLAQEGAIPEPCTLSTESAYTLPVPPPLLIETLHSEDFPPPSEGAPAYLHVWYRVILKNLESTDDRLDARINETIWHTIPIPTPNLLGWEKGFIDLTSYSFTAGDPIKVELRMTTRTGATTPTLLFIGAVEISDEAVLDAPTLSDSLDYFEYSSNLGPFQEMASMGVINLRQIKATTLLPSPDLPDLLPDAALQNYLGRLGGVGMPYMAVNLCATRKQPNDYVEVIFETDILYEDALNKNRLYVIPDLVLCCERYHYTIPTYLLNRAGRPRLHVHIDPPGSRVIADDFTLSYIARQLYPLYPDIAMALSWIPNGDFESGLHPYVIEPGPEVCPELNRVIVPTPDACRGTRAAVFELPVMPADVCPEGSVFNQPPSNPDEAGRRAYRSNSNVGFMYERVRGVEDVRMVEWWGLWYEIDPDDPEKRLACDPPATAQGLSVWVVTNTSDLETATAASLGRIAGHLYYENTGIQFTFPDSDEAALYRYTFIPHEAFALMDGWLSVQQTVTADTTCFFFWLNSPFGDGDVRQWTGVGATPDPATDNMSLCLVGGPDFAPAIYGCSITPAIVGRGMTGTLTLYGQNLRLLDAVVMAPEMPVPGLAGDPENPELSVTLMNRTDENPYQNTTFEGRLGERISVSFRFNGPFNPADDGNIICTDGRAEFYVAIGAEMTLAGPQDCSVLIDTIAPEMIIEDALTGTIDDNDASRLGALPHIRANGLLPSGLPIPRGDLPGGWAPNMFNTPRNNRPFGPTLPNAGDMHLYVNPGGRNDVPYGAAGPPPDVLTLLLQAAFIDLYPVDSGGTVYEVEIAGFTPDFEYLDPYNPFTYLPNVGGAIRAMARWSGSSRTLYTGGYYHNVSVVPAVGARLDALWHAASEPDNYGPSEPWTARFKLEARDRAGNTLDMEKYRTINLYWHYRVRAEFQTRLDATVEFPEIFWQLYDRGQYSRGLPGVRPNCEPLAKFGLYMVDDESGVLARYVGQSGWRDEPVRGATPFDGTPLQTLLGLPEYQGQTLCLTIIGADEAGNVQYEPENYLGLTPGYLREEEGVDNFTWHNGERPLPNQAVDTNLRLELFHERYNETRRHRNYGPATRIPLPPLAEACDTFVNGFVRMQALTPTAQRGGNVGIVWKFFKEGTLVARGFRQGLLFQTNLLEMLFDTTVGAVSVMGDFKADGSLNTESFSVAPCSYLNVPPTRWPDGSTYLSETTPCPYADCDRLGDEGDPPLTENPNAPSQRRREIRYTLTAQTVVVNVVENRETGLQEQEIMLDRTPATVAFSVYVRDVEEQVRDEAPVREFGR